VAGAATFDKLSRTAARKAAGVRNQAYPPTFRGDRAGRGNGPPAQEEDRYGTETPACQRGADRPLGTASARAEPGTTPQPPAQAGQQQLAQEDLEFATKAAQGGIKEVRLGELAQQQAATPEVQQFGQRMVQDHGQANEQLMQISESKGIELPKEMPQEAQQLYDELQQKSGQEFDQAYMDEMVSDHHEDVEAFQHYVEAGRIPTWRASRSRPCRSWSSTCSSRSRRRSRSPPPLARVSSRRPPRSSSRWSSSRLPSPSRR
jgi:putative membrane protein